MTPTRIRLLAAAIGDPLPRPLDPVTLPGEARWVSVVRWTLIVSALAIGLVGCGRAPGADSPPDSRGRADHSIRWLQAQVRWAQSECRGLPVVNAWEEGGWLNVAAECIPLERFAAGPVVRRAP